MTRLIELSHGAVAVKAVEHPLPDAADSNGHDTNGHGADLTPATDRPPTDR